jgi:hypothetical protein
MIQAITESTFHVFLCTEDNRINTSVTSNHIWHLWKFINDMDGSVQYAYAAEETIQNRYTTFSFLYSDEPDMFAGQTKLIPSGHYKYEVYEVSWLAEITLSEDTAPATEKDVLPVEDSHGVVQGLVTKGILNMTDYTGKAQVQYTQRVAPDSTNYIYYGQ